jgi:hypothetical protein
MNGLEEKRMTEKPWISNKPEQRLSIAMDRFLTRALIPPCYFTALHDADGGGRTDLQRIRDANRGIRTGQLDWDVVQFPGVARKLELKRGKNKLSPRQVETAAALTACGLPPIVAWTLREAYTGLADVGFRFVANVETILQHYEALLESWDREADGMLSGEIVKKRTFSAAGASRQRVRPGLTWKL